VERESNATRRTMSGPTTDHTSERRDVNLAQPVYVCCVNINGYMTWNAAIGPSGNPLEVPRKGILTTRFRCRARWIGCMPLHGMAPTPVPCAMCHVPCAYGASYADTWRGILCHGIWSASMRSSDDGQTVYGLPCGSLAVWRSGGIPVGTGRSASVDPRAPGALLTSIEYIERPSRRGLGVRAHRWP
jgi:hypothetical protein